jgi:hypothetical protein
VSELGGRITRLRILSDVIPGVGRIADVSYIHATLPDGTRHEVLTGSAPWGPGFALGQLKGYLIQWARTEGVFAKGLGLLDEAVWSVLK